MYLHSNFSGRFRETCYCEIEWIMAVQSHLRSLILVKLGTNRKRVCNFLLVINSNFDCILPRFRDIAGFLLRTATPRPHPYSTRILGVFPLNYCRCSAPRIELPKLIIRVISFQLTQHIRPRYINVSGERTGRQTDRRTTYDSNSAIPRFALHIHKEFTIR